MPRGPRFPFPRRPRYAPLRGQLGIQIGSDGAVPVGGRGVIQQYLQSSLAVVIPQQHTCRFPVAADDIDPVCPAVCRKIREIRLNVLPVVVQQIAQKALTLRTLHQAIAPRSFRVSLIRL